MPLHHDGNGDVLEIIAVHGVDGDDLTGQCGLVGQALAGFQRVGFLQDRSHIHSGRQQMVPGVGDGVAVTVGDGSGQDVGGILLDSLVDVDGDHAVLVSDDLDNVLAHVDSPDDLKINALDGHIADTLVILGGLFRGASVNRPDILHCGFQILRAHQIAYGSSGLGGGIPLILLAACEQTQAERDQENPCKYFFHSKLLIDD